VPITADSALTGWPGPACWRLRCKIYVSSTKIRPASRLCQHITLHLLRPRAHAARFEFWRS